MQASNAALIKHVRMPRWCIAYSCAPVQGHHRQQTYGLQADNRDMTGGSAIQSHLGEHIRLIRI